MASGFDIGREYQRLLSVLYQCPFGLCQIDAEGRISLVNTEGARLLMALAGGTELENLFEVLRPFSEEPERRFRSFEPVVGRVCNSLRISCPPHRDGDGRPLVVALTVHKLDRSTAGVCIVDVSDLVAQERDALQAWQKEGVQRGRLEVVTTILHDIGNAVTGIGTQVLQHMGEGRWLEVDKLRRLARLLEDEAPALDQALGEGKGRAATQLLDAIVNGLEGRRRDWLDTLDRFNVALGHVRGILEVERRFAQGGSDTLSEEVDLPAVVEDALVMLRRGFDKRSIQTLVELSASLPRVRADRSRMTQVIVNLLKNSCEAFDGVGVEEPYVSVKALLVEQELVVEIKDNGAGITATTLARIRERGFTTKPGGTGIGLASCMAIMESHGGRLDMESEGPGQGTTARVRLPVKAGVGVSS